MDTSTDQNDWFFAVMFGRSKVFFWEDDSVALFAYLFKGLKHFGVIGDGDHVDQVEVIGVT